MFYVSKISTDAPERFATPLQAMSYRALDELHIPFERVDTDEAITMEDCVQIEKALDMKMVKTLFLCSRQKTAFYLFVTTGEKSFSSKNFSKALGISRVSFAPAQLMGSMLGTKIGAATVFSAMLDTEGRVQVVFDRDVLAEEWYGCSDGTTTGYMKLSTEQLLDRFMPYTQHTPQIIEA